MGKVKSALEIALEKASKMGELSREEKEKIQDEEKVASVLRDFYQGKLDSGGLWQKLKGSKSTILGKAQMSLIETLSLGTPEEEFQRRGQAIVAIETLKERPDTAVIEASISSLGALQKEYREMKERIAEDLGKQMETHPQLRMQPVRTPDGKTVMQVSMSVDEAVKARMGEYLSEHEEQYDQEFSDIIEELKMQIH